MDRALELVEVAAAAGADAVKFQTFVPELLATRKAVKARYQLQNEAGEESQLEMLTRLSLTHEAHHDLVVHCKKHNIQFLSSPFDLTSAEFLIDDLNLPLIKLGSGEITNGPLLYHIACSGRRLLLSTGMSNLVEVGQALLLLAQGYTGQTIDPGWKMVEQEQASSQQLAQLRDKVTLLHCTTEYPCPLENVNLRAMDTLWARFGIGVGYSDHTKGITTAIAAVARGATVLEKHFTLDRNLPGPDHKASLEPDELAKMVRAIRETESVLGEANKQPAAVEVENARVARKSLVAAHKIKKGELYSEANLTSKRPGTGLSPMGYWGLLGQPANQDYDVDEAIEP